MEKVTLLFGVHMHQPVDNFSECIEEAVEKSYKPFFEVMMRNSEFKFSLHCSGWLLNEIRKKYPELFKVMKTLTEKGSIEWLTAGYYEPVLSSIPSKDRIAQIKKLNRFLKKHLGVHPKGLWLTERVWESALIPDLVKCGIEYVVVDDYHFLSSGFAADKLDGYYTTEEGGAECALFPISKPLRYDFPFSNVEKGIESIFKYANKEGSAAVFFDDAEKFGLWPHTFEWVYEKGWLESFVRQVLAQERITTQHYTEYKQKQHSLGIAYLNNTSYFEMGEWSLKNGNAKAFHALQNYLGQEYMEKQGIAFVKGGIWKNFFVKYPESNYLHKRMLWLSKQSSSFSRAQKEALYKLQTNDVFWHGVFGGIYLPNLRDNAYRYLLEIERGFEQKEKELLDIDQDGYQELKVRTDELSLVFSLKEGGALMELGSFETLFNWQNTLMRKEESYHFQPELAEHTKELESIHDEVVLDEVLKKELVFDVIPRYSFIDCFSTKPFALDSLKGGTQEIQTLQTPAECKLQKGNILFFTQGSVFEHKEVQIEKRYKVKQKALHLDLQLLSESEERLYYGLEFNLHFAHLLTLTLNGEKIAEGFSQKSCREVALYDDFTNKTVRLRSDMECDVHAYIASSIAKSESGYDKTPQQLTLFFSFSLEKRLDLHLSLEICDV
ncbi:alpha-amylase/4-alpha-glucanotransferase domain-containing protein [Sulfurimonas microaerophilic]|uniref:alpha-amylase/4-alpha-glucanotransferase domain-containing protein n=1 Tax=Sulfurimonas microaerophilic TaxID=3058392 RepID=UPI002715045B|nr:alpha-amylase/4-alpha-glucanotransferase domain-containing protein [Sulfurimonas sp. hsl 1-7]